MPEYVWYLIAATIGILNLTMFSALAFAIHAKIQEIQEKNAMKRELDQMTEELDKFFKGISNSKAEIENDFKYK